MQKKEKLKHINKQAANSGPVLLEYVIMLMICVAIALSLMTLFGVFGDYGKTIIKFIGVDYP